MHKRQISILKRVVAVENLMIADLIVDLSIVVDSVIVDQTADQMTAADHLNVDHQIVNRAVLTATRPVAGQCVRDVYAFEVPSSTEWALQTLSPAFRPNVFVDVEATLPLKLEGMACYESETRAFPHPRSREALDAIAKRWGSVVGCKAAEAFELLRSVR